MAWKTTKPASLDILKPLTDPTPDNVLVLESNKPCNKTIDISNPDKWAIDGYKKHFKFGFKKLILEDITKLYEDIKVLAETGFHFIVLGTPTDYAVEHHEELLQRLTLTREDQVATIESGYASIAPLDIDSVVLPDLTYDAAGAQMVVDHLVNHKMPELEGVSYMYQWTSKAGAKPNAVRLRLIFMLSEATLLTDLKAWAAASGQVDKKIYEAQQPIYIANPTFVNGISPISDEDRMGLVILEHADVPPLPAAPPEKKIDIQKQGEDDDVILAKLYEEGWVKAKLTIGKYEITCPWKHEHTDEVDSGAVFMLPNYSGYTQHAFKCQHDHCSDKKMSDLLAALNIDPLDTIEPTESSIDENDVSIPALINRYAYIKDQDKFYDFATGHLLKLEALNRSYNHVHLRPQAGTALLRRAELCRADTMIYLPGHERITTWNGMNVINLWKDVEYLRPVEGNPKPWLDHLKWLISDKKDREHILDWSAYLMQNLDVKINHALLISGPPRIGKDTLLEPLKRYLGSHNVNEPSAEELKETFTNYLHHSKLVVFQECQNFDKLNIENKLKPMLASPPNTLRVRLFGIGFYETPNLVQCIFMSNHRNALKLSRGDGRYYCIWCEVTPKPEAYYHKLYEWLNKEGYAIVVNYLLNRDVSHFNPHALPPTNSYKDLITALSSTDMEMMLEERIANEDPPFHHDLIKVSDIMEGGGWEGITIKRFTTALDSLGCIPKKVRENDGKRKTHNLWAIRNYKKWINESPRNWIDYFNKMRYGVRALKQENKP